MPTIPDEPIYYEKISSNRTEALFLALTILPGVLSWWRIRHRKLDALAWVFISFACIFLFYSANYRTLIIRLTSQSLQLKFGLFTWIIPLDNIENCALDEVPTLMRLGGAGIHFMFIRKRYRASFNFLDYSRLVVALKRKAGLVQDVSFSTRRPSELFQLIRLAVMENSNADGAA